jgi:hypothetical protein
MFFFLKKYSDSQCCWENYGFLFRSEFFFRTTRELEYLFFLSGKALNFSPEFNIRLDDKNSESDYDFFSSAKIRIFCYSSAFPHLLIILLTVFNGVPVAQSLVFCVMVCR